MATHGPVEGLLVALQHPSLTAATEAQWQQPQASAAPAGHRRDSKPVRQREQLPERQRKGKGEAHSSGAHSKRTGTSTLGGGG
jgi:hypothetical protein